MISFLANPARFKKFSNILAPIFGWLALITLGLGLWFALWHSPEDELHKQSVRIMYIHVPAAWSAMMAYATMAISSAIAYIWRHPLADELAKAAALPGAAFTALALITGSLWGKTSWGTFWQWDGRMTSVLILFFLYIGYLQIWVIIEDKRRAARLAGLLAMVGSINLPIIKFSVDWWFSMHQTSTISSLDAPGLDSSMLTPLLLMAAGYSFFFGWLVLNRVLHEIHKAHEVRRSQPAPTPAHIQLEDL
jgi:heme exporter protein C